MAFWTRLGVLLVLDVCGVLIPTTLGLEFNNNLRVTNGQGFLVYPILPTLYPIESQSVETEQFYIYNQNTATKIQTSFGNFKREHNITYNLNDYSGADPLSLKVVNVDAGANITAHLVQTTVTNTKPHLKVLVHSDRRLDKARCVRVYAKRSETETVSESCTLKNEDSDDGVICLASVPLPYEWWSSRDIDVYFDVQDVDACTRTSNKIRRPSYSLPKDAYYVGEVVLMFDDRHGAREITEDPNVGLSIPDKPQQVGERFPIVIKLHPGSKLNLFIIRAEFGEGLTLSSVNSSDESRWDVRMRRTSHRNIVDVEAFARDGNTPSLKVQEVMEFVVEVMKSTVKLETEIKWTIEYSRDDLPAEGRFHQQSVLTTIPLSKADQVTHLVAVLKTHELVSLRRFTKSVSTIPVWLYAIDRSGKVSLANSRSHCYSTSQSILEVSTLCDMIYLSGEGSDPRIVDVVFEYANIKHTVDVRVWYPDVHMFIKLTDDRLSEIKGWKVRTETNEVDIRDSGVECNLQYQSSDIRVYTKFYTVHERRDVFMRGGKVEVFADVTAHVRHLIETSNRDIVRFEDGILHGVSPGKATVKVVNAQGATLTTADIRVTSSKTEVERISGNFVSDINLVVSKSEEQGLLTASYNYERALSDKQDEGLLELWIHFTDGTVMPLAMFDRLSYNIKIENETPTILGLPSKDYRSRYLTVRAVGSGRGRLKLSLHMDEACQKKATRYLAIGNVYIESQLSKPAGLFVNDAAYKSNPQNKVYPPRTMPTLKRKPYIPSKTVEDNLQPSISNAEPVRLAPDQGKAGGPLSPLETGMFVLMGVLGVVASVFVTNCLIYTYRQQKNRKGAGPASTGSDGTEKVDSGWVWLNRNTLEQNAISTSPEQFLSERDFQKRCSRSDSLQSTRSKRSSTGTYKGSECSVRITVNPRNTVNLPDLSDSEDELYSAVGSCRQPVIGIEEPELSDLGGDEDFSLNSLRSKRRRQSEESGVSDECHQSFIVHSDPEEEKELDTSETSTSLTQEQFDNLRETVA